MQVKQLQCSIHPNIVSNILNHYMRRPKSEDTVVGTLLGSVDGQMVDLQTCYSVPSELDKKGNIVLEEKYNKQMLAFHRKVNPKEDLVGLYVTGTEVDAFRLALFKYYKDMSKE